MRSLHRFRAKAACVTLSEVADGFDKSPFALHRVRGVVELLKGACVARGLQAADVHSAEFLRQSSLCHLCTEVIRKAHKNA